MDIDGLRVRVTNDNSVRRAKQCIINYQASGSVYYRRLKRDEGKKGSPTRFFLVLLLIIALSIHFTTDHHHTTSAHDSIVSIEFPSSSFSRTHLASIGRALRFHSFFFFVSASLPFPA
ncbi:hypothetical protein TMatcc_008991 [Talaromyces marneffei ATCC 18224]